MNEYKQLLWYYKFLQENREFLKFTLEYNAPNKEYYIELYVNDDVEDIKGINIYDENKRYLSELVFDVVIDGINLKNILIETKNSIKVKLDIIKKELKQEVENLNLNLDTKEKKEDKYSIKDYKDLFYLYGLLKKYNKNIFLYIDKYHEKYVIKFDINVDIFSGDKIKLSSYVLANAVYYLNKNKDEILDKVQEHIKKKLDKTKEKMMEEIKNLPEVEG